MMQYLKKAKERTAEDHRKLRQTVCTLRDVPPSAETARFTNTAAVLTRQTAHPFGSAGMRLRQPTRR